MSIITHLRQLTGLTAENIANLTGLSRSNITMAEGGYRDLPTPALLKITRLLQVAEAAAAAKPVAPVATKEKHGRHARHLETHAAKCRLKAQALEKRLDFCKQQQQSSTLLAAILQHLQTSWKEADEGDKLWLAYNKAALVVKNRKQEKSDWLKLEWELEDLEASANLAEKRANIIRKKIAI